MLLLSAICICLIFGGLVLFSAGIVRRALGRVPVPTRLLATMLVGMMLTTALFHALLWVGWFNRWLVSGLAVLAIAIAYFRGHSAAVELERIGRDMALLPKLLRRAWRGVYGASALVVVAAVVATASRMLILPPLAWDALTYHVVKAAMWVQAGGPLTFEAPGGWSFYKLRLAGAESFVAWAMLPSGNDLLVCALDMVWWLGTGCAVAALGCELGLRVRQRWAAVTYALWPLFRNEGPRAWALAVAGTLVALAFVRPGVLAPFNRVWTRFGLVLHRIVSPLVLGLLFFATVTPTACPTRSTPSPTTPIAPSTTTATACPTNSTATTTTTAS